MYVSVKNQKKMEEWKRIFYRENINKDIEITHM